MKDNKIEKKLRFDKNVVLGDIYDKGFDKNDKRFDDNLKVRSSNKGNNYQKGWKKDKRFDNNLKVKIED